MTHCPKESVSTRKELLVATRHLLSNAEFRHGFVAHMDALLEERILLGIGGGAAGAVTTSPAAGGGSSGQSHTSSPSSSSSSRLLVVVSEQTLLRPLAYATLSDLVQHFSSQMTFRQLSRVVLIFSRVLHDPLMGGVTVSFVGPTRGSSQQPQSNPLSSSSSSSSSPVVVVVPSLSSGNMSTQYAAVRTLISVVDIVYNKTKPQQQQQEQNVTANNNNKTTTITKTSQSKSSGSSPDKTATTKTTTSAGSQPKQAQPPSQSTVATATTASTNTPSATKTAAATNNKNNNSNISVDGTTMTLGRSILVRILRTLVDKLYALVDSYPSLLLPWSTPPETTTTTATTTTTTTPPTTTTTFTFAQYDDHDHDGMILDLVAQQQQFNHPNLLLVSPSSSSFSSLSNANRLDSIREIQSMVRAIVVNLKTVLNYISNSNNNSNNCLSPTRTKAPPTPTPPGGSEDPKNNNKKPQAAAAAASTVTTNVMMDPSSAIAVAPAVGAAVATAKPSGGTTPAAKTVTSAATATTTPSTTTVDIAPQPHDASLSPSQRTTATSTTSLSFYEMKIVRRYIQIILPAIRILKIKVSLSEVLASSSDGGNNINTKGNANTGTTTTTDQYRDVLTYFAASFSHFDGTTLRQTVGQHLDCLIDAIVEDPVAMVIPRHWLACNPGTSFQACSIILEYLVGRIEELSVVPKDEQSENSGHPCLHHMRTILFLPSIENNQYNRSDHVSTSTSSCHDSSSELEQQIQRALAGPHESHQSRSQTSLALLQFFERVLKSLASFPDNEYVVRKHLKRMVVVSFRAAMEQVQEWPDANCMLLRYIFRSISAGKFEESYKELLPLIPAVLNGLYRVLCATLPSPITMTTTTHNANHHRVNASKSSGSSTTGSSCSNSSNNNNTNIAHTAIELCLTIPARLSSLLPHLNLLLRVIVPALDSDSGDLVNLGYVYAHFMLESSLSLSQTSIYHLNHMPFCLMSQKFAHLGILGGQFESHVLVSRVIQTG